VTKLEVYQVCLYAVPVLYPTNGQSYFHPAQLDILHNFRQGTCFGPLK